MTRKPLPDDFNVQAFNAGDIMVMLEQQVGIPLRATIDMDLQPLHDLMRLFLAPEDRACFEYLIIIDDETAELLKDLLEDADDAEYGAAMNRLISSRPHGRSRELD